MKLLAAVFVLILPLSGQAAPKEIRSGELKTLLETKNERVLAKEKEKEAADFRRGHFLRSFLPKVELHGAMESFRKGPHGRKEQPAFGAEASLNLLNGGRDYLESERRALASERKGSERLAVIAEELDKAREAYWGILYLRDFTSLLEEAVKLNQSNLKSAERRIRSGVATQTDRVEFEMEEIDLKRELALSKLELESKKKTLSVLLGFDPGEELLFPEPLNHEHKWEDSLVHSHEEHGFLVKPTELLAREQETLAKIEGRTYWPKLEAYAAWNQFNEREEEFANARDRRESVVGLRVSLDLFDGFNASRESSALRAESAASAAEASYLNREIEIHIDNEIASLKLLHAQVHEAEENTKRASRYHELTQSEYSRGVKNSPDMLGASERLIGMRQKYLEMIRDFQIAKSHVLSKIGR